MKELWYKKELSQVCSQLGVDTAIGLTQKAVEDGIREHGKNKIPILKKERSKTLRIFIFASFSVLALLAIVIAFGSLPILEGVLFFSIYLLFGALVSYLIYAFYKSKNELASRMAQRVSVMRGGMRLSVSAESIVPGDLIFLKKGDVVPADAYLVKSVGLSVLEGPVTDNYSITQKQASVIKRNLLGPSEMSNLLFATSVIASGEAIAIAFATGKQVAIVDVAAKRTVKEPSFFLKTLTDFSVVPCFLTAVLSVLSFAFTFAYSAHDNMARSATISLALLTSALSFFLPHISELSLLIRNRSSGESFFRVKDIKKLEELSALDLLAVPSNVFLSADDLEVGALFTANEKASYDSFLENPTKDLQTLTLIAHAAEGFTKDDALFNSDQLYARSYRRAILDFAKEKYAENQNAYTHKTYRLADVGFRFDTSLISVGDSSFAVMKGPYRKILSASSYVLQGGRYRPLDETTSRELSSLAERFEAMGFEVIAYARSAAECNDLNNPLGLHNQMHLLGMFALCRRHFPDNAQFFADCTALDIRPVILHDGYKNTFIASFKDAEWFTKLRICDGRDLPNTQAAMAQAANDYDVFCALSEKQKHDLIKAFRHEGYRTGVMENGFDDYFMSAGADIVFACAKNEQCAAILDTAHVLAAPKATTVTQAVKAALQSMRCSVNAIKYLFLSVLLRTALVFIGAIFRVELLSPIGILFLGLPVDCGALAVILFERFHIKKGRPIDRNVFVNQFSITISLLLPLFYLIFAILPICILYAAGRPMTEAELKSYAFFALLLTSYLSAVFYTKRRFNFSVLLYTIVLGLSFLLIMLIRGIGSLIGFTASPLAFLALIPAAIFFELTRLLPLLLGRLSAKRGAQNTSSEK